MYRGLIPQATSRISASGSRSNMSPSPPAAVVVVIVVVAVVVVVAAIVKIDGDNEEEEEEDDEEVAKVPPPPPPPDWSSPSRGPRSPVVVAVSSPPPSRLRLVPPRRERALRSRRISEDRSSTFRRLVRVRMEACLRVLQACSLVPLLFGREGEGVSGKWCQRPNWSGWFGSLNRMKPAILF